MSYSLGMANVQTNLCEIFRHNLRRLREERGLSQSALARHAEVAQGWISDLEAGKRRPTLTSLQHLAEALGVPAVQLLTPPQKKSRGALA